KYHEYKIIRKDGSTGWIGTNIFTLMTKDGIISVSSSVDITKSRLAEELAAKQNSEIQSLYQVSLELNQSLDYDELLHTLYQQIALRMECDNFFVSSYDEETSLIHAVYANMENNRLDVSAFPPIPLEPEGKGTQSRVIRSGEALLLNDYHSFVMTSSTSHYIDPQGLVNNYESLPTEDEVTRAGIILPLLFQGKVLGAVQVMSYNLNAYTEDQFRYAKALIAQFGIAYNNALLYREAQAETAQRKRIETALQESDQKFSKAFEYAINGMTLTSLDGNWLKVNSALCQMVGYSETELLAMNFSDITVADDLEIDKEVNSHLLKGTEENFIRYQKRYIHKDGHLVWVLINLSVVRDDNGQPLYFISQVSDISDIKQVEAALKLQGAALENAANAIVITDKEGIIEWINPAWSKLTGFTSAEAFGKTNRILKSGHQDLAFYQSLWKTLLAGQVFRGEFVNKRKDGSLYTAETVITPVINENNEITHFVSVIEDVTQRNAAEENLRSSEESHRLILQLAMDGYWKLDMQGKLLDVNEAYCRMSGYTRDELLLMSVSDLEANETPEQTAEHIKILLNTGYERFESNHRRKDGTLINIELSAQY
ncbi:MAG: PAS domain S-box protein, partial [Chloroflexota bacterium]